MTGEPQQTSNQETEFVTSDPTPDARLSEDWWAVILGGAILAITFTAVLAATNQKDSDSTAVNPLREWIQKPAGWQANPVESLVKAGDAKVLVGTLCVGILSLLFFGCGIVGMRQPLGKFAAAFPVVFLLATLAYIMAGQAAVKLSHLGYPLWAILLGLMISNTIGTPEFLKPAVKTEFYIKTGLVIFGAEILFGKLLELGKPGIFIAWVVTPIVLITTYWFGQKILGIASRTLNITISADMSVCGVSAAIATAAACRAKKEELTTAVAMSLMFTVIMMVAMPVFIEEVGMDKTVGAAWMGGTIDATGAVAAAGEALGEEYLPVAATIKMIQNILIGVIAFGVSVYWTLYVDRDTSQQQVGLSEIWRRFPKFILGFIAASIVFSWIYEQSPQGASMVSAMIGGTTKILRGWFFCLAFVCIGLETNFRELRRSLQGGKPLVLYLCGQALNLCLTLLMAWLMFKVVFPEAADVLAK